MPAGIETEIENGFARVSFPDPSLRGPALQRLLEDIGPDLIDVDTSGRRKVYIVPASAAVAAGLVDGDEPVTPEPAAEEPVTPEPAAEEPVTPEPVKAPAAKKAAPKKAAAKPAESGEEWA
jgi:hypothetical protein